MRKTSSIEFTRLPARGKSSFDELYAKVDDWLGERKCQQQVMLFGETFYEHALSFLLSERIQGRAALRKRFYGKHLFHYTSLDVFKTLRERGADLMCTRFSMLNDSEELMHGFSDLLETFAREDKPIHLDDEHRAWLREYFETQIQDGVHGSWVMSFSELDDDLYQWSAYTDRCAGGCAIAFDARELHRIVEAYRLDKKSLFDVYLVPCVYYLNDFESALFMSLYTYNDAVKAFASSDLAVLKKKTPPEVLGETWDCLVMVAALSKHYCFACEHEWRLVVIPKWNIPASDFPSPKLVGGKMRYALHQTSSTSRKHYSPKCIRGIMLSPHGNKDFNRTIAKSIIGSDNDPDCRILESYLPYNGK